VSPLQGPADAAAPPPGCGGEVASGRRRGRPRSPELTERFLAAVEELLARRGLRALSSDGLATDVGAGKAAFYRRWPDVVAAAAEVVSRTRLLACPADQGSLTADVAQLSVFLTRPLSTPERAVGALVGVPDDRVRSAFRDALDGPAEQVLRELLGRAGDRGETVGGAEPTAVAVFFLRSLVLSRLASGPVEEETAAGAASVLRRLLAGPVVPSDPGPR